MTGHTSKEIGCISECSSRIIGLANHGRDSRYDIFLPMINKKQLFPRLLIEKEKQ